jgi:putative DNA primase/helicase
MNKIEDALSGAEPLVTLDPSDPMRCARAMVDGLYTIDGCRIIHRYRGEFWRWDRNHYRASDDEMIRSAIWGFLDHANRRDKDGKPVPFKPTRPVVSSVFDALSAVVQLDKFTEPPTWLDGGEGKHPAAEYVPVDNGLLHLPTRELLKPTPTFFGLNASTVAYDPKAPEPTEWLKFLAEVLEDETAITTLRDWFGYTLSADTSQQKILLAIGPKRSGKGTMARIQTALLGKHSVAGPTMASLSEAFGLEPLIAKPLAIISDARIGQRSDKSMIVERLLTISGEDTLTVGRKFKLAWSGRMPTRIEILTNEMPSLADGSGALVGRFVVLLFQKSFYGRENVGLTKVLLNELPGILNWALEGYAALRERGHFDQPENATEAIEAMEMLGAPIKAFIRDKCVVGPAYTEKVDRVYLAYVDWCQEEGLTPRSKQWFGRDLQTAVSGLTVTRPRADANEKDRSRLYQGLALEPF